MEHSVRRADRSDCERPFVMRGDRPLEVLPVVGQVLARVAIPRPESVDVRRLHRTALTAVMTVLLVISLWEIHFVPKGESCQVLRR